MDDVFKGYLSIILVVLSLAKASSVQAVELEFLHAQQLKALESQFDSAKGQIPKAGTEYSCEMYGVRTRLQVQRNTNLYIWHLPEKDSSTAAVNSGDMPIIEYVLTGNQLVGRHAKGYQDQVRWQSDGTLVSRLTLSDKDHTVLSYSVCRPRLDTLKAKAS
jgi:hypothetical protein